MEAIVRGPVELRVSTGDLRNPNEMVAQILSTYESTARFQADANQPTRCYRSVSRLVTEPRPSSQPTVIANMILNLDETITKS